MWAADQDEEQRLCDGRSARIHTVSVSVLKVRHHHGSVSGWQSIICPGDAHGAWPGSDDCMAKAVTVIQVETAKFGTRGHY